MGGREFELATAGLPSVSAEMELQAAAEIIKTGGMLLPNLVAGSGPFPTSAGGWRGDLSSAAEKRAAVSLYQALMTETCLENIGADGPIIIEGPFAANQVFLAALQELTGRTVLAAQGQTGTALGAAYLAGVDFRPGLQKVQSVPLGLDGYAGIWRDAASA